MAKQVKLYDPARDAYFTADLKTAKKYLATLEKVKKEIEKAEGK